MVECSKIREFHSNSEFSTPILMHQGLTIPDIRVSDGFLIITPSFACMQPLRESSAKSQNIVFVYYTSYGLEEIHGLRQRQQFCQKVTSRDSYKYYAVANY
mmetsp:Transcript_29395/g.99924  ORF Transcript_29395/g.99924 Transcript_29395/m.99924 type:complete len:101 (-) Transcript_29395:44-346(-)